MNQTNINPINITNKRIAFIEAGWNKDVVSEASKACLSVLEEAGLSQGQADFYDVPGSLEIPLQAKWLAKTGKYDVIIACGLITDSGIYRHEFVAKTVIEGMMTVQLETEVPILSVVLTPHQCHDTDVHLGFFKQHFKTKGKEAAHACLQTFHNIERLSLQDKAA